MREKPLNLPDITHLLSVPMSTVAELSQASDLVLRKVISGELTVQEARGMAQLIADRRKVLLMEDEEKRAEAQFLRMRARAEVRRRERNKEDVTLVG